MDDRRILRYDLTLLPPLTVRYEGRPLRIFTAGKTYRAGTLDAMHPTPSTMPSVLLDEKTRLIPGG